jgi:hypothetical protein
MYLQYRQASTVLLLGLEHRHEENGELHTHTAQGVSPRHKHRPSLAVKPEENGELHRDRHPRRSVHVTIIVHLIPLSSLRLLF